MSIVSRGERRLNIVVCVKQVPDTTAKKDFDPDFTINRSQLEAVINPFDEYAIEEALRLKEALGGEVIVLTMGPASAEDTMRKALAMGADRGMLITDPALHGSDSWSTAYVLAAALRGVAWDLIVTGMESTDARTGLVPAALAEQLGAPSLTYASSVSVDGDTVTVNRQVSGGYQQVSAPLPALVSVVKGVNEPRYPSLKGIMAAKRKEIQKLDLAALEIEASQVGLGGSKTSILEATPRAEKAGGQVVKPNTPEEAARVIADFLQANKFI
jgi:electron transfer flavoprotein beta subunit